MLRDTSILGADNYIFSAPTFEVIRLIDIGVIFNRIESIYAAILVMLVFFRVSITFFATISSIAQTFNLRSYKILVLIFGVLIIVFSLIVFDSDSESSYWGTNVAAVYSTFFEVLLPAITLVVAIIKEKLGSKEVKIACK
jgi:spore germination protein KB